MGVKFDQAWVDSVMAACDPVFSAADVGFGNRVYMAETGDVVNAIFWMARPGRFLEAYPDSGLDEQYGSEWPDGVADIDFTVGVDVARELILIDAEPWSLPTIQLRSSGDDDSDAVNLARVFARLLGVDQRQFTW